MRKIIIVISALVILATIIGCGFLMHDVLTYESEDDKYVSLMSIGLVWMIAIFSILYELTISHCILYFISHEWKTKMKSILNGISLVIVVLIPVFGFMRPEFLISFCALILIRLIYFVIVIVERSRALINKIRQRKNTENSQVHA